ncbi:hypothetical protein TSAR_015092 [Trichomalopsis sarcophagae]|uniref:Uncharacterized protein n=1 Tax=Trichomalopsis sarcophagae TaxID=543379 RepID=A0A232FA93_9HYME|nr:hypothetical protein TSAR_015092 [Trichomalopsis sarcophagae]
MHHSTQRKNKTEGKSKEKTNILADKNTQTNLNDKQESLKSSAKQKENLDDTAGIKQHRNRTFQSTLAASQTNESIVDRAFDFGKEDQYSDIGGFSAELSLVVGTEKDPCFKTFSLIDFDKPIREEAHGIQEIADNKQSKNNNENNSEIKTNQSLTQINFISSNNRITNNQHNNQEELTAINQSERRKPKSGKKQHHNNGSSSSRSNPIDEGNLTNLLKVRMTGESEEALSSN